MKQHAHPARKVAATQRETTTATSMKDKELTQAHRQSKRVPVAQSLLESSIWRLVLQCGHGAFLTLSENECQISSMDCACGNWNTGSHASRRFEWNGSAKGEVRRLNGF